MVSRLCWDRCGSRLVTWDGYRLKPRQNGRHFAGGILKCNFWHKLSIFIQISHKFVRNGAMGVSTDSATGWHLKGDKPLAWTMTHTCICVTQWFHPPWETWQKLEKYNFESHFTDWYHEDFLCSCDCHRRMNRIKVYTSNPGSFSL